RSGEGVHRRPGGAPPRANVPGRVPGAAPPARDRMGRAVRVGLNPGVRVSQPFRLGAYVAGLGPGALPRAEDSQPFGLKTMQPSLAPLGVGATPRVRRNL